MKQYRIINAKHTLCFAFLLFSMNIFTRNVKHNDSKSIETIKALVTNEYKPDVSFIDAEQNQLKGNTNTLDEFFEQLYTLRQLPAQDTSLAVNILHIGDSHLQAGFLNGVVMKNFHHDFGNAGRGLISPLKLAKTNAPFDYIWDSESEWQASRCIARKIDIPVGVSGLSLMTRDSVFDLHIKMRSNKQLNYGFDRIKIFHHPKASPLKAEGNNINSLNVENEIPFLSEIRLNNSVNEVNLKGFNRSEQDSSVYYGMSLENGHKGVLYHTVGLNGAQFIHYARIQNFSEQTQAMQPRLIIFSLGTNEAFRGHFSKQRFYKEMSSVIDPIRKANPNAAILLTTPAECQQRKKVNGKYQYTPNPYIEKIRQSIIDYANEHDYPYWDLYDLSGGKGSSENWVKNKMLARDKVHFFISGYNIQGNLLYQAIIKSYNTYVELRHTKNRRTVGLQSATADAL